MIQPSTFSIVAYSSDENAWGVAVASKFPAVGAVVPWTSSGAGAVATQALANTSFGPKGLEMMRGGITATAALEQLLAADEGRDHRQVGLVDKNGQAATFTGSACMNWAGGLTGSSFAVQGNILVGEEVVQAMANAYQAAVGSIVDRLYAALFAGDRSGGDRRGRQSAAILVVKDGGGYAGFNDRWVDYRVDDHPDPVARLADLLELHHLYFEESPAEDRLQLDTGQIARFQRLLLSQGYYQGQTTGEYDAATKSALAAFIGNENFEERCDPKAGWIDRPVYEFLIKRFPEG